MLELWVQMLILDVSKTLKGSYGRQLVNLMFLSLYWYLCSNSARFLWKSIPSAIKESQPEVRAAWRICQCFWMRDYEGVHEAILSFDWSQEAKGLVAAFSGKRFLC